jgi:hypothetical protein
MVFQVPRSKGGTFHVARAGTDAASNHSGLTRIKSSKRRLNQANSPSKLRTCLYGVAACVSKVSLPKNRMGVKAEQKEADERIDRTESQVYVMCLKGTRQATDREEGLLRNEMTTLMLLCRLSRVRLASDHLGSRLGGHERVRVHYISAIGPFCCQQKKA